MTEFTESKKKLNQQSDIFTDWVLAPNIHHNTKIYELENEALLRDGRLDRALEARCDWEGLDILDIGCGTGFWLPIYAQKARQVVGVEPDASLLMALEGRVQDFENIDVLQGSAESIPLADASVDIVHARFAYFFGKGAESGLREVLRVLRPGGTFIAIDNGYQGGDFSTLLDLATVGNGAISQDVTNAWWCEQGAQRLNFRGGWQCTSSEELEQILRIEFTPDVVDQFLAERSPQANLSYDFVLFCVTKSL